jgi:hypothetical protein
MGAAVDVGIASGASAAIDRVNSVTSDELTGKILNSHPGDDRCVGRLRTAEEGDSDEGDNSDIVFLDS